MVTRYVRFVALVAGVFALGALTAGLEWWIAIVLAVIVVTAPPLAFGHALHVANNGRRPARFLVAAVFAVSMAWTAAIEGALFVLGAEAEMRFDPPWLGYLLATAMIGGTTAGLYYWSERSIWPDRTRPMA